MAGLGRYVLSLPERLVRAGAAVLGGTLHEGAQLVLPRFVRRSRLYEATAKNLLRLTIELVGRVDAGAAEPPVRDSGPGEGARGNREVPPSDSVGVKELAARKGAGNVVELGSIAAFGFSPLWLLAAASDVLRGSRLYLDTLVAELKTAGVLASDAHVGSVDELLGALERSTGRAAALIDVPPLELAELRRSLDELRADAESLPSQRELAGLFEGLVRVARAERRPLLEVSEGIGLAFLLSAQTVARDHLVVPYREDWRPLRREGFAAYARRVAGPYREAVAGHFDVERPTWTERLLGRLSRDV